jgi:hypothetical protein
MKIRTVGAELFRADGQTKHDKASKNYYFFFRKRIRFVSSQPCSFYVESNPIIKKREMCWFNKNLLSDIILSISSFHRLEFNTIQQNLDSHSKI